MGRDTLDRSLPKGSLIGALAGLQAPPDSQRLTKQANRRELKYAVQIKPSLNSPTVMSVIIVNVDCHGGMTPARIKEQLARKILDFMQLKWPGMSLQSVVCGRVDFELP